MTEKEEMEQALQLHRMQVDMEDMKNSMSKIAEALTKIAVLEEKHQAISSAVLKALEKIESVEARQSAMEMTNIKQSTAISTAIKAVVVAWAVLGTGITALVWKVVSAFAFSAPVVVPAIPTIAAAVK